MTKRLLAAALVAAAVPACLGQNFDSVVPGRVYRSGQLPSDTLEERIHRHGLKSIVNLRGEKDDEEWYRREREVAERTGVELRSIDLLPEKLPRKPALVALIDALETLPEPILIHCAAGADRTGVASVLARMALGGAGLEQARSELSLRHGHLPFGPASEIAKLFDEYASYRRAHDTGDDWTSFERWARESYVPYVYKASLSASALPAEAAVSERMELRVRVRNESPGPWVFETDPSKGIKLGVKLLAQGSPSWIDYDRHSPSGRELLPGESLEIEAPIVAPSTPGAYELKLDMVDEHVTWFEDQGSEPLVFTLTVRR